MPAIRGPMCKAVPCQPITNGELVRSLGNQRMDLARVSLHNHHSSVCIVCKTRQQARVPLTKGAALPAYKDGWCVELATEASLPRNFHIHLTCAALQWCCERPQLLRCQAGEGEIDSGADSW